MSVENVSGWIGLLLAALTLASFLGVIVAYLRVSLAQATIATLKESNDALTKRNSELDSVIVEMKAQMLVLTNDNRVLREAVGGKESNERIIAALDHHHDTMMADRNAFATRFTESQVVMGQKIDATHKAVLDVLVILGSGRK